MPRARGKSFVYLFALVIASGGGLSSRSLSAQDLDNAVIEGQAVDTNGDLLPGVIITLRGRQTGFKPVTRTGGAGRYRLVALPPGIYTTGATLPGFTAAERGDEQDPDCIIALLPTDPFLKARYPVNEIPTGDVEPCHDQAQQDWAISPTKVNHFRFPYSRFTLQLIPGHWRPGLVAGSSGGTRPFILGTGSVTGSNGIARNAADGFNNAVANVYGFFSPSGTADGAYQPHGLASGANDTVEATGVNPALVGESSLGSVDPLASSPGPQEFHHRAGESASDSAPAFTSLAPGSNGVDIIHNAAPPNDDCIHEIDVTDADCPLSNTQSTAGATTEGFEPTASCGGGSASVWYGFTAATRALVRVSACGSDYDTIVSIYQTSGGAGCFFSAGFFDEIACNNDSTGGVCSGTTQSELMFVAEANLLYKIRVGGVGGARGNLQISIDCKPLTILINEVQPLGASASEWIELVNTGSMDIELNNWTISDNSGTDTLPRIRLAPGASVVVAADSNQFMTDNPGFMGDVVPLNFPDFINPGTLGSGLNNGGDCLILRDDTGMTRDRMSYGNEGSGSCIGTFISPPPVPARGQTLQRSPSGFDTDQGSDWVSGTSTPGETGSTPTAVVLSSFTARQVKDEVMLGWETASEFDIAGFNVWRGSNKDGPLSQINGSLILSQPSGGLTGARYQFVDRDVRPGETYFYLLEAVRLDGWTERLGALRVKYQAFLSPRSIERN